MTPLPWSFSSLADFKNCPKAFYEKRIAKSVKEEASEQMLWGNQVHKAFENRQKHGFPLPDMLQEHEPYMKELERAPGEATTERKVGLSKTLQPCSFFAGDVWFRGVIDYMKIYENQAKLVDYKTGKRKDKFDQLSLFALHTFAEHPQVNRIDVEFYWTQTKDTSAKSYSRNQIAELWQAFVPDLKQYAEAFRFDTWQPRESGLCHGWCPVTSCEFWKPRRTK